MGSRPRLSVLAALGAISLVIAIFIGNRLGSSVMRGVAGRAPDSEITTAPVSAPSDDAGSMLRLRRRSVLSVATDPAFPDPRITPEPTPKPTQAPTPKPTRTPEPSPSPSDDQFDGGETPQPFDTTPPTLGPGETPSPAASTGP